MFEFIFLFSRGIIIYICIRCVIDNKKKGVDDLESCMLSLVVYLFLSLKILLLVVLIVKVNEFLLFGAIIFFYWKKYSMKFYSYYSVKFKDFVCFLEI